MQIQLEKFLQGFNKFKKYYAKYLKYMGIFEGGEKLQKQIREFEDFIANKNLNNLR